MSTELTTDATAKTDAEILALALKRFRHSHDAEAVLRGHMLADKKFAAGEHWDSRILAQRERDGDPCLVIDLLKPQIKQIANQSRQMLPEAQAIPVNGGANPATAEVLQGMFRHIEQNSDADDAYIRGAIDQLEIGRGWWRYLTEYVDGESADQEIRVQRIRNPLSVYPDPLAQARDYADAKFLFETSDWLPEDVTARYPKATLTGAGDFEALGNDAKYWVFGDRLRIALYWVVSTNRIDTVLPSKKTRPVEKRTVTCYVMTGLQILERYQWAGTFIPYVPVLGEEIDIEGKVDLRGVVRMAKDPQRHFNYQKSKIAEVMALAPLAPWVMVEGQDEGYEKDWQDAGRKKISRLKYRNVSLNGTPAPPPSRNFGEPPIQAMMEQAQAAQNEVRMATGFSDVTDSQSSSARAQESGRALLARQQQGEHGTSDYLDGLSRAIRHGARIMLDLIPHIYDTARVLRIIGADRKPQTVMVHAGAENAPDPTQPLPDGVKAVYDLAVGRYDVRVSSGPSYRTAREQFEAMVGDLIKADPPLMQLIGDLYFENMDIPEGKQIAERLRKVQDPRLQSDTPGDPSVLASQVPQLQQQIQQLQQELAKAQAPTAVEQVRQQGAAQLKSMDLDFQREKMQRDSETKIAVAELGAKVENMALFLAERARLGLAQTNQDAAAVANAHDVGIAAMGHAHGQAAADAAVARQPDPADLPAAA